MTLDNWFQLAGMAISIFVFLGLPVAFLKWKARRRRKLARQRAMKTMKGAAKSVAEMPAAVRSAAIGATLGQHRLTDWKDKADTVKRRIIDHQTAVHSGPVTMEEFEALAKPSEEDRQVAARAKEELLRKNYAAMTPRQRRKHDAMIAKQNQPDNQDKKLKSWLKRQAI